MSLIPNIITSIILGALIAGGTNVLAIIMLFRPHKPAFWFGRRLPFTPGLIPGKQKQLAITIGDIVASHILTPAAVKESFNKDGLVIALQQAIDCQWERYTTSNIQFNTVSKHIGIDVSSLAETITSYMTEQCKKLNNHTLIVEQLNRSIHHYSDISLQNALSSEAKYKIEHIIDQTAQNIIINISKQLQHEHTKKTIVQVLDESLAIKNPLFKKISQGLLADPKIQEQIIEKLQSFIHSDSVSNYITDTLFDKWNQVQAHTIHDCELLWPNEYTSIQQALTTMLHTTLDTSLSSEAFHNHVHGIVNNNLQIILDMPIHTILNKLAPYKQSLSDKAIDFVVTYLQTNTESIVAHFDLRSIVEHQVASFPSQRLEEMALQIAKKELQYITLIGALIGAVLGVLQFLLAYTSF